VYSPGSGESLKDLFARADASMYEAKRGGKGRYNVSLAAETSE
jgi:PleD family two-component response regulator